MPFFKKSNILIKDIQVFSKQTFVSSTEFALNNTNYNTDSNFCGWIPCFSAYPVRINANAPSPVTLQAVPKESCKAKMVSIKAVPVSSKPSTPVISPKEAITVPPGTPGAPIANTPSKRQKRIIFSTEGNSL